MSGGSWELLSPLGTQEGACRNLREVVVLTDLDRARAIAVALHTAGQRYASANEDGEQWIAVQPEDWGRIVVLQVTSEPAGVVDGAFRVNLHIEHWIFACEEIEMAIAEMNGAPRVTVGALIKAYGTENDGA